MNRQRLCTFLAAIMAAGAIAGSVSGLLDIADRARMAAPAIGGVTLPTGAVALVLGLDGVALVAALLRHGNPGDRLALGTLIGSAGISTALQVMGAPPDWLSRAAHGSPPVMALWAFELVLRAGAPTSKAASKATPSTRKRGNQPAAPPPPPAADTDEAPAAPVTDIATARHKDTEPMPDEEIARLAAERLTAEDRTFSRRNWEDACKHVAGVGRVRAGQVRHLAPDTETGT